MNGLEPAALNLPFRVFDRDGDGRIDPAREWIIRPWPVVERAGDARERRFTGVGRERRSLWFVCDS